MEQWKVIKDFPKYAISNYGNIKFLYWQNNVNGELYPREKLLTSIKKNDGYLKVNLHNDEYKGRGKGRECLVHRLVAEAFLENPKNLSEINHKDGNKENNKVSNLEWCTRRENVLHSYKLGLKKSIQEYIKIKRMKEVIINGRYK